MTEETELFLIAQLEPLAGLTGVPVRQSKADDAMVRPIVLVAAQFVETLIPGGAYPVARINEVPAETNVYITESSAPPAGVGEPGVPPFVAAFCNAIFAATGKRVRDLPLSSNPLFG